MWTFLQRMKSDRMKSVVESAHNRAPTFVTLNLLVCSRLICELAIAPLHYELLRPTVQRNGRGQVWQFHGRFGGWLKPFKTSNVDWSSGLVQWSSSVAALGSTQPTGILSRRQGTGPHRTLLFTCGRDTDLSRTYGMANFRSSPLSGKGNWVVARRLYHNICTAPKVHARADVPCRVSLPLLASQALHSPLLPLVHWSVAGLRNSLYDCVVSS